MLYPSKVLVSWYFVPSVLHSKNVLEDVSCQRLAWRLCLFLQEQSNGTVWPSRLSAPRNLAWGYLRYSLELRLYLSFDQTSIDVQAAQSFFISDAFNWAFVASHLTALCNGRGVYRTKNALKCTLFFFLYLFLVVHTSLLRKQTPTY